MTNKTLLGLLLILSLSHIVFSQQELCRVAFEDGQKYVLYKDGTFKYQAGSIPIPAGGALVSTDTLKCGETRKGEIWLKANGTWKFVPAPDISKLETKSFDDATSDRISIVDKVVRVEGTLREADWYWGWFKDYEATHLSFRLTSDSSARKIYLYYPRGDKANELRAKMRANGNKLEGKFDLWFSTLAYESTKSNAGEVYAELLDYRPAGNEASTDKPSSKPNPNKRAFKEHLEAVLALKKIHDAIDLGTSFVEYRRFVLDALGSVTTASALLPNGEIKEDLNAAYQDYAFYIDVFTTTANMWRAGYERIEEKSRIGLLLGSKYGMTVEKYIWGKGYNPKAVLPAIDRSAQLHLLKSLELMNAEMAK